MNPGKERRKPMAEKKPDKAYPSQFDKVKEITDKLEAGIQALFESEAFKNYLKTLVSNLTKLSK